MVQTELRPSFKHTVGLLDFIDRLEATVDKLIFTGSSMARMQLQDMNDPQMDAADIGSVVINQTDDTVITAAAFDNHFLLKLSLHSGAVPIVTVGILKRDMAADTDTSLRMQPTLALPSATGVLENPGAIGVGAFEDNVGNQLFESWVCFTLATRLKRLMLAIEDRRKVPSDVCLKTRERSELLQQQGGDDKHFFIFGHDPTSRISGEAKPLFQANTK
jgi:hypothetical protein